MFKSTAWLLTGITTLVQAEDVAWYQFVSKLKYNTNQQWCQSWFSISLGLAVVQGSYPWVYILISVHLDYKLRQELSRAQIAHCKMCVRARATQTHTYAHATHTHTNINIHAHIHPHTQHTPTHATYTHTRNIHPHTHAHTHTHATHHAKLMRK